MCAAALTRFGTQFPLYQVVFVCAAPLDMLTGIRAHTHTDTLTHAGARTPSDNTETCKWTETHTYADTYIHTYMSWQIQGVRKARVCTEFLLGLLLWKHLSCITWEWGDCLRCGLKRFFLTVSVCLQWLQIHCTSQAVFKSYRSSSGGQTTESRARDNLTGSTSTGHRGCCQHTLHCLLLGWSG